MATIADMHAYNMLQRIGPMNEGLAMGKEIPPGKGGSPGQPYDPPKPTGPYVPAPSRNLANLADGTPDASIMNYVTEQGFFLDGQGGAYMQTGGKLYDAGEYNPDIHGLPVPLVQQMKINQDVANITPKDFSPPPFRYIPHIRIPEIKRQEMDHMKNFIEAMGGDTKGLVNKDMMIDTKLAMEKAPVNKIKPTWPWRTRPKNDSSDLREIYDPVTGLGIRDFG